MSKETITQTAQRLSKLTEQVNPYPRMTRQHALYELGLIRTLLAHCIEADSDNWSRVRSHIHAIDDNRTNNTNNTDSKTPL